MKELERRDIPLGNILNFTGIDDHDIYNITAPFDTGSTTNIAVRVEKRELWAQSHTVFFQEDQGIWVPAKNTPTLPLEDPFVVKIKGELIVGGVQVYGESSKTYLNTVFYKGADLTSLEQFATGPDEMKDIRLVELPNGKIGVFTRPQGTHHGRGEIGYTQLDTLEELNARSLQDAKIIKNQFTQDQWGGVNEVHILKDSLGIIGHIAQMDTMGNKHYYAMSFQYYPESHVTTPIKIIAQRKDFPQGEAKAPCLQDVIFPGGLIRHTNKTATLYTGISDTQAGSIILPDPFL